MNMLFVICGLFFVSAYVLIGHKETALRFRRQKQGLSDVLLLRDVLELVPQHRGMLNALLTGDESLRAKIDTLQVQINRKLLSVAELVSENDRWLIKKRVTSVQVQWSDIKQNIENFTAQDSFTKHTVLINDVLCLINDVADAAGLLSNSGTDSKMTNAAINELPVLIEVLGQARGMGTGVAVSGSCSVDMRVKLRFVLSKIHNIADEVAQKMSLVSKADGGMGERIEGEFKTNQQAIKHFLSLLGEKIIEVETVKIASSDYYAAGTEAIKHSFNLLDLMTDSLGNKLEHSSAQSEKKLWGARFVVICLCVPAVLLIPGLF